MTDPHPQLPALQRLNHEAEMYDRLSAFQQCIEVDIPVVPTLRAVLTAARPAFDAGFAYTASFFGQELTVTLHHSGAELGSSAPAAVDSYSETCARLLAGLLGIPLLEGDQPSEPEAVAGTEPTPAEVVRPQLQQDTPQVAATEESSAPEPEPEEFDELGDPEPSADIHRTLTEQEKDAAVAMVKALPADRRRTFSKSFREVFAVPEDAKQIVPFMTELQHLQFIDRYTVEASGGIAA
jgi:hypothetical protein